MRDVTLAEKVLSWKPVVMLDEELKKTIDYFTEGLSSYL
jgi:nucleoside-diphosphate-sugar epimerase